MNDKIDEVLRDFDFDKVHKAMVAVEWKWSVCGPAVPTREQLVAQARELLESAVRDNGMWRTGGLSAWCYATDKNDSEYERGVQFQIGLSFTFETSEVDVY